VQGSTAYHQKYLDTEFESSLIERHYPDVSKTGLDGYVKDLDDVKYGTERKKSNFYVSFEELDGM
jgi:hypothetical protein